MLTGCVQHEKEPLSSIILSPHEQRCLKNKAYQDVLNWYLLAVLQRHDVKQACIHGFFSSQELIYIFKVCLVQQLSQEVEERNGEKLKYNRGSMGVKAMEGDPKYQLWVGTFSKMIEQSIQMATDHDQRKRASMNVNSPNKDHLYTLFQEAMGVERSVHQSLVKACQVYTITSLIVLSQITTMHYN